MDEATFTLEQAGFQVTTTPKEDESVDEGTVLAQDPAGGTKQQKGTTITLTGYCNEGDNITLRDQN